MALLFHDFCKRAEGGAIHLVDGIVHGEHAAGQLGVAFDEGLQAFAHHVGGH